MEHRNPATLESATGDLVHLIKEGFLPVCVTGREGSVVTLLVDDRESFLVLKQETQRLVDRGASVEDIYRRAAVNKLRYDLVDATTAYRLLRRIGAMLERQTA